MTSITNPAAAPAAATLDESTPVTPRPKSLTQAQAFSEAANNPALLQALAAMGVDPTDATEPNSKREAVAKLALPQHILAQPPPLPNDRAPVTQQTQALFESMNNDVTEAMERAQPKTNKSVMSAQAALQSLAEITEEQAQTPEGQAHIASTVAQGAASMMNDIGNLSNAGMMAAFMILQVRNDASGKELTSVMQDLTSEARKSSLDVQIAQNKLAMEKVKEANDIQKKMGILAPLIEAIMAIAMVALSVFSAGSMTALAAVAFGAVVGFLAGGVIGGSQKGNGFDAGSAFMGMGIGGSVAGVVAKLAAAMVAKLLLSVASRSGIAAAEQAGGKLASFSSKLAIHSDMTSMGVVAASTGVQAAGSIIKAGMQYQYDMATADAKEHQARAKMEKAISDMLQNLYQTLSTSLQGLLESRNNSVNQALAMLKSQFGAMQRIVSQISG